MSTRVLFVDDDPHALAGFQCALRGRFAIEVALGGPQGLQAIATRPPFAVVVAVMRMPGMSGVQFLHRVRETSAPAGRRADDRPAARVPANQRSGPASGANIRSARSRRTSIGDVGIVPITARPGACVTPSVAPTRTSRSDTGSDPD